MVDEPTPAPVTDDDILFLETHRAPDCASYADAGAMCGQVPGFPAAVGETLAGAHDGELRRPVHPPDLLRGQGCLSGSEVAFPSHLGAERRRIKEGDPSGCSSARRDELPERAPAEASRRHDPNSGDHYPPIQSEPPVADRDCSERLAVTL
jgi:hypothetical protein